MKKRKGLALAVMAVILVISLTGCIVIPLIKYYDIPSEKVASIQFYDLRGDDRVGDPGFDKIYDPAYTLPKEDHEAFLDDFSRLEFSDAIIIVLAAIDPSFYYGEWVVRINYTNGDYTFYSCAGYGQTFDAGGNQISSTHYDCDDEELEHLIGKYYEIPYVYER